MPYANPPAKATTVTLMCPDCGEALTTAVRDGEMPLHRCAATRVVQPFAVAMPPVRKQYHTRPRRRITNQAVARYHRHDPEHVTCFHCGEVTGHCDDFNKAHIIDTLFFGLDGCHNLGLLCDACNDRQPLFKPVDEAYAIEWFGVGFKQLVHA